MRRAPAGRKRADAVSQSTSISCRRDPAHRRIPFHCTLWPLNSIPSLARARGDGPRACSPSATRAFGLASNRSAGKPGRHQRTSRGVRKCLAGPMVVPGWTGHRPYGGAAGAGRWSMSRMPTALPRGAHGALGLWARTVTVVATHREEATRPVRLHRPWRARPKRDAGFLVDVEAVTPCELDAHSCGSRCSHGW